VGSRLMIVRWTIGDWTFGLQATRPEETASYFLRRQGSLTRSFAEIHPNDRATDENDDGCHQRRQPGTKSVMAAKTVNPRNNAAIGPRIHAVMRLYLFTPSPSQMLSIDHRCDGHFRGTVARGGNGAVR
jgi:hypothetical protein